MSKSTSKELLVMAVREWSRVLGAMPMVFPSLFKKAQRERMTPEELHRDAQNKLARMDKRRAELDFHLI